VSAVITTTLKSLGVGALLFLMQRFFGTQYLSEYLRGNLITILVALLAINAATLGVVLTKLRDLIDKSGGKEKFKKTRAAMLLSVKEQMGLIVFSIPLFIAEKSELFRTKPNAVLLIEILIPSCLAYALFVLYDTTKSVFVLLDFQE
jgi:hypothetical protein